ncbi:MAG: biotin--[acetyl-CoA-carboxylase] ligase [Rickettsiaceae bacterium]|nr:biotin--[acetyl-CoA-carboxylase] ligase [Rickettsiaceae bacterium]
MANNLKWLETFHLLLLDEIDSTNDEAKRIALSGQSPDYLVICAKKQNKGRGRSGNNWESLDGNLFMSLIVPSSKDLDSMSQLSFVSSLALENLLSNLFKKYSINNMLELKWPNDVLINDKKVAGILLETAGKNNEYLVIGIGVNITQSPVIEDRKITNLHEEGLLKIDRNEIMNRFMSHFSVLYKNWQTNEFLSIRSKWLKKAKGLGKIISVNTGSSRISGRFMDIDFKGQIRLHVSSGQIHSVNTGELFFGE